MDSFSSQSGGAAATSLAAVGLVPGTHLHGISPRSEFLTRNSVPTTSCYSPAADFSVPLSVPSVRSSPSSAKSCLLVVDLQPEFYSGNQLISTNFPHLSANIPALLKQCREHPDKCIVTHIRADYSSSIWESFFRELNPDKPCQSLSPCAEQFAAEVPGEHVFFKPTFDAFLGTDLHQYLQSEGVTRVFVSGVVTSACVLQTAFGAFFRGFETSIIADCCGDR